MELQFWAMTDPGRVREHNEDNFLVDKRLQLFVVCDGMGGHAAGEVASAMCVRLVREAVLAEREVLVQFEANPDDFATRTAVLAVLEHAIRLAGSRIFEMSQEDPSRRGMGTTCCTLLISGDRAFIAHVGDSRLYVVREGRVSQITEDHSLINEMIRQGKLKPGEGDMLPNKNAVTRAVGVKETVEIDTLEFELEHGDRLLMCSDGLSGYFLSDNDMLPLLEGDDLKACTQRCIDFANDAGGKDNITVILVDSFNPGARREVDETNRIIELLVDTPYFHYLNNKELQRLMGLARRQVIAPEGTPPDALPPGAVTASVLGPEQTTRQLNIVISGQIALELHGRPIATLGPGDHFGELSFVDEKPDRISARVLEPSVLMSIDHERFVELLRSDQALAIKLLWNFLQVFSGKLRQVPYEFLHDPDLWWSRMNDALGEATPPRATNVATPSAASHALPKLEIGGYSTLQEPTDAPFERGPVDASLDNPGDDDDYEDLRATIQFDWSSSPDDDHLHTTERLSPAIALQPPGRRRVATPPRLPPEAVAGQPAPGAGEGAAPADERPGPGPVAAGKPAAAKVGAGKGVGARSVPGKAVAGKAVAARRPAGKPAAEGPPPHQVPPNQVPPAMPGAGPGERPNERPNERPLARPISGVSVVQASRPPSDAAPAGAAVVRRAGEYVPPPQAETIEIASDLLVGDDEATATTAMRPAVRPNTPPDDL